MGSRGSIIIESLIGFPLLILSLTILCCSSYIWYSHIILDHLEGEAFYCAILEDSIHVCEKKLSSLGKSRLPFGVLEIQNLSKGNLPYNGQTLIYNYIFKLLDGSITKKLIWKEASQKRLSAKEVL